ncbi:MAG: DTW domain-containing protein [Planctomycetota bacterium]|nr:DTW domain-containing protein [Planctomycetota bacterium]
MSENNISPARCYQCFRPQSLCFCDAIPQIENRTDIVILQHIGERFHPFNTARIVRKALRRCVLIADHNRRFASHQLPIRSTAGLLYPDAKALALVELSASERPDQLVVIDGTWSQAKTIFRDVPQLRDLPCYRLKPSAPGQYRIRREPDAQSLSTLEATVAALQALEPDTIGLNQLLSAFHRMVECQLAQTAGQPTCQRQKTRQSGPRFLPKSLLQNADHLVVAYGEATPGGSGQRSGIPSPVNWVAQRLGTGERFSCCIQQQRSLADPVFQHMRLSTAEIHTAVSRDEFYTRWNEFHRRNDVLVVYHQKTCRLLEQPEISRSRCLVLKSIFRNWQSDFHSQQELMMAEGVTIPDSADRSRATLRLDMAIALVEHLRTRYPGASNV